MLYVAVFLAAAGKLWLKLDITSKKVKQDAVLLAVFRVTATNLPLAATRGLSSSSARMDYCSPDGCILSPEVRRVPAGKGERCTSRRWPQLLCLAWASCWLRPGPSLPRALSFPAGLSVRMGPGMLRVSLASRTNNRRWRHPRSFSLLMICSKDDFPSLKNWLRFTRTTAAAAAAAAAAAFTDRQKKQNRTKRDWGKRAGLLESCCTESHPG